MIHGGYSTECQNRAGLQKPVMKERWMWYTWIESFVMDTVLFSSLFISTTENPIMNEESGIWAKPSINKLDYEIWVKHKWDNFKINIECQQQRPDWFKHCYKHFLFETGDLSGGTNQISCIPSLNRYHLFGWWRNSNRLLAEICCIMILIGSFFTAVSRPLL